VPEAAAMRSHSHSAATGIAVATPVRLWRVEDARPSCIRQRAKHVIVQ